MSHPVSRIIFVLVNALGLPGVGTVLAGRPRIGWIQMIVSLILLAASAIPLIALASELYLRGMTPTRLMNLLLLRDTWIFSEREWGLVGIAVAAAVAYAANLLWSLTTTQPVQPPKTPPPLPPSR